MDTHGESDALSDVVSRQYERWVYPEPIEDLPGWLTSNWQWFDPSHSFRVLWPERTFRPDLDILVAGCGTNQAAVLAFTNPDARVIGIDVSEASLGHHRHLADKYRLGNLELHRLPIEQVGTLDRTFDLIVTTGVLHHLADPAAGMRALGQCLRSDAVLAVMLYATYGRMGVEMMQSVFRDFGLKQDARSVGLVREAIACLGPEHPLQSYLAIAPDLTDDAGIVDTFLHGRERAYTIDGCRQLVADAGLAFQDLFLRAPYYAPTRTSNAFLASISELPREEQWSVMERVNPRNACHFFMARRGDQPVQEYIVDLAIPSALEYVPSFRYRCGIDDGHVVRSDWRLPLDSWQTAVARQIDGTRSIRQLAAAGSGVHVEERERQALELVRSLWQLDFVAVSGPGLAAARP